MEPFVGALASFVSSDDSQLMFSAEKDEAETSCQFLSGQDSELASVKGVQCKC